MYGTMSQRGVQHIHITLLFSAIVLICPAFEDKEIVARCGHLDGLANGSPTIDESPGFDSAPIDGREGGQFELP